MPAGAAPGPGLGTHSARRCPSLSSPPTHTGPFLGAPWPQAEVLRPTPSPGTRQVLRVGPWVVAPHQPWPSPPPPISFVHQAQGPGRRRHPVTWAWEGQPEAWRGGPAPRAGCLQPREERAGERHPSWPRAGPRRGSGLPLLEDMVLFLIIQNFQTLYYHIQDTRCQRVVTKREPREEASVDSSAAWAVRRPAPSPVAWPLASPSAPLAAAGGGAGLWVPAGAGGLCPSRVPGLSGVAQWRHRPLAPDGRLSVAVLALRRGGQCQGPGGDPAPRTPRPRGGRPGQPPLALAPRPRAAGRRARCRAAGIVKLNFPDVQAPGARACCLERKWGLGKAEPCFPRLTLLLRCHRARRGP